MANAKPAPNRQLQRRPQSQPAKRQTPSKSKGGEEGEEKEKSFFKKIFEGSLFACALFILAFVGLIVIAVIALISVLGPLGFNNRPSLSGDIGSGGGYIVDSAFPAVKNVSASDVMGKLSRYQNLKGKQSQVQMIIDKSRAAGINYYILLDIWAGEQTFGNDNAAMGCGVYGGANRASGFENQVDCAIGTIKKTLNNVEPYNNPTGQNRFTRLFYNYTAGMQDRYKKLGYVAECNDARLTIHKILAPEEVVCSAAGQGPGLALVGDKLYPPLGNKMTNGSSSGNHSTWSCKECKCCAVDYGQPAGTPIYAVADGRVEQLYLHSAEKGYTFYFYSNDGQVYAVYGHITPSGKLSTNDIRKTVSGIHKGDQLGVLYPYHFQGNGPHLHFELHINGQPIGIVNGHNRQLDYFGNTR